MKLRKIVIAAAITAAGAGALLDVGVGVDEDQAEALGKASADGRLAGAHRADQHEVGSGIHGDRC